MKNRHLLFVVFLLTIISVISGSEINYMVSAGYIYDSNIAQNVNEVGKGYFLPEGYLRLRGNNLFGEVAVAYENHVTERLPVLNTPFLAFTSGLELGESDDFDFISKVKIALYYGQNVDYKTDETISWFSAKNSYRWYNNFKWDVNRSRIFLNTKLQVNDYGGEAQDAVRFTLEPQYRYRFRTLKSQKIALTSLSFVPVYEGNFAHTDGYDYTYFEIGANTSMKFWGSSLKMGISYASKKFGGNLKHPITEEQITVKNNYFYTNGSWTFPIADPLDIKLQGKLRFKESNNSSYEWNRHTFGVKLVWRGGRERR